MTIQLRETWDDFQTLELQESKKAGVLGILKGPSFFEDRPSRNKRQYKDCWKPALSQPGTKRLLEDGLMFGTVGHMDTDLDGLIRENKVAIRASKLNLQENGIGHGEFEILDTPLGRFLHTAAKSGSKFAVSSKAMGESKGKDNNGNEVVDPKTFKLDRFDIVCDPGFLDARPELREKLNEAFEEETKGYEISINESNGNIDFVPKKEDVKMAELDEKLTTKILKEKMGLEEEVTKLSGELSLAEAKIKMSEGLEQEKNKAKSEVELLTEELKSYREFLAEVGTPEAVKESLAQAKGLLESYKGLGTPEQIEEALLAVQTYKESFTGLGEDAEVIRKALEAAKKLGETVQKHGGIVVIEAALDEAYSYINEIKQEDLDEAISTLSAKYGVKEESVRKSVEKNGVELAEAILEDLKVTRSPFDTKTVIDEKGEKSIKTSRVGRMVESMTGRLVS